MNVYISDETMKRLERAAKELGRSVEDLASVAIEEAALQYEKDQRR